MMEVMEATEVVREITYSELKNQLEATLRLDLAPSTLSRWMRVLKYPKGLPGRRRKWEFEDFKALQYYGHGLRVLKMSSEEAHEYAMYNIEYWRNTGSWL